MKPILLDRVIKGPLVEEKISQDHSFVLDASAVECIDKARREERIGIDVLLENARLPFPKMWIEYETRHRNNARWSSMGPPQRTGFMLVSDSALVTIAVFDLFGTDMFFYPMLLGFSSEASPYGGTLAEKKLLWGPCRLPAPLKNIGFEYIESKVETRQQLIKAGEKLIEQIEGDLSFCIFALALLNTRAGSFRETITKGRWIDRGNTRPLSNYTTISINLEKRYISRPGKQLVDRIVSHHKRLHEVRGHWRQLGQKKVWVRNHQRGDETLGKVIQQREVIDRTGMTLPANPTAKE